MFYKICVYNFFKDTSTDSVQELEEHHLPILPPLPKIIALTRKVSNSAPPEIEQSQHRSDSEVTKSPNYSPSVHSSNNTTLTTHDLNFEESSSQDEVGPFWGQKCKGDEDDTSDYKPELCGDLSIKDVNWMSSNEEVENVEKVVYKMDIEKCDSVSPLLFEDCDFDPRKSESGKSQAAEHLDNIRISEEENLEFLPNDTSVDIVRVQSEDKVVDSNCDSNKQSLQEINPDNFFIPINKPTAQLEEVEVVIPKPVEAVDLTKKIATESDKK